MLCNLTACLYSHKATYCCVQIVYHSPPLDDIPFWCPHDVRRFLTDALTVNAAARPDVLQLSKHDIFKQTGAVLTRHLQAYRYDVII